MRVFFLLLILSLPSWAQNNSNETNICQYLLNNSLQTRAYAIARQLQPKLIPNRPVILESYVNQVDRFYRLQVTYRQSDVTEVFDVYTHGPTLKYELIKPGDEKKIQEMAEAKSDNETFLSLFRDRGPTPKLPEGAVLLDCYVAEFLGDPPIGAKRFSIKISYRYRMPDGSIHQDTSSPFKVERSVDQTVFAK